MTGIQDENENVPIVFQWTKSHNEIDGNNVTEGNAHVDHVAKQGCNEVLDAVTSKCFKNYWSFYNMRATINYSKRYFRQQQEDLLLDALDITQYGDILKRKYDRDYKEAVTAPDGHVIQKGEHGLKWNKYHYRELSQFTRNEIRLLLRMRTGHNELRHYMSKLFPHHIDPICHCGTHRHHLIGLMEHCQLPAIQQARSHLISTAFDILRQDKELKDAKSTDDAPKKHYHSLFNSLDPTDYLYPKGFEQETAILLKKAIIRFYKSSLKLS